MSRRPPIMFLDMSKKPGDADCVRTAEDILAENERLKAEIERLRQPGNVAALREARSCNAHCDDYECEKNAGGVCRAPNPCLGYEEAGKVLAELEAAKRELAKSSAGGDAAKLREAMCEILSYIERFHKYVMPGKGEKLTALFAVADTIRNKARAALAVPPRNCDRPECKDIQSAMNVYRRECCVDCGPCYERRPGAMREAEWLLAPAKEQEGGEE